MFAIESLSHEEREKKHGCSFAKANMKILTIFCILIRTTMLKLKFLVKSHDFS